MPRLTLRLLGPPQIAVEGAEIRTDRRKAIALLVYLAVTARPHSREALSALLWPDYDKSRASAYLRRTLWELQQAVGEGAIDAGRDLISLNAQADVAVDVREFRALVSAWRQVNSTPCDESLDKAAALYTDDFLAGFGLKDAPDFDDWAFFEAESLKRDLSAVLEALAECALSRGQAESAIEYGRRWLALDPLHEPAHRLLIRAYDQNGQRSAAVRQFNECERLLRAELNAPPQAETIALFEQIQHRPTPNSPQFASQAQSAPVTPAIDLRPAERTPFVGRAQQLEQIATMLANPHCRLITLTGPGGVGKTRIARRAVQVQADGFEHGAFFVPLAPVLDAEAIVPAIASAIGFEFFGTNERDTTNVQRRQLFNFLREKNMLLALDNYEHLIDAAPLLAEVLHAAPHIKLLVTSRERLNVQEEWVLDIPGMRVPADNDATFSDYSAIKLFVQTAQRARAGFVLTEADQPHVAHICQMLGGLPLGIELAAAWARTLSPQEIAGEIARNMDFVASPSRNIDARHANLRAVFDYSWRLLSAHEQRIFPRLAAFQGGFTREAVLAVAGAALPVLQALVDKSLVYRGADGRYDLHPAVRQYAAEKLAEHGDDAKQTLARHAAFYAGFASAQFAHAHGPTERAALDAVNAELDNVRSGFRWTIVHRVLPQWAEYADCLFWLTESQSRMYEGDELASEALAAFDAVPAQTDAERALAATLFAWRGMCRWRIHTHAAGRDDMRAALTLARSLPEQHRNVLANVIVWLLQTNAADNYDEAGDLVIEAMRIFRAQNNAWGRAILWGYLGLGDPQLTRQRLTEALHMHRARGDVRYESMILNELGEAVHHDGYFAEAMDFYAQAMTLARKQGDLYAQALVLDYSGFVARQMGDFALARENHTRSLALSKDVGDQGGIAGSLNNLGLLAFEEGNVPEARRLLEQGLAIARRVGWTFTISWTLELLADVELALGNVGPAEMYAQESIQLQSLWTGAHRAMGHVRLVQGRYREAAQHFLEGVRLTHDSNLWHMMQSVQGLALLAERQGQLQHAAAIATFIVRHHASDFYTRQQAQALLARMSARLPPQTLANALAEGAALTVDALMITAQQALQQALDAAKVEPARNQTL